MVSVFNVERYNDDQPFSQWLEDFEDGVLANFGEVADRRKKAILMQLCGEAVKKYACSLDDETKKDYPKLIAALIKKFTHHANETVERHIFNTMMQLEEENIDSFLMRLKLQAKKCNYIIPARDVEVKINTTKHTVTLEQEDISETLIRDRIVVGVANQATKTRLLREHNLTLETAVSLVKALELADKRIQTLLTTNATSINAIGRKRPRPPSKPQINKRYKTQNPQARSRCGYCGNQHQLGRPDLCPAYQQKCSKCGMNNHFARVCRSRQKIDMIQQEQYDDIIDEEEAEMQSEHDDSGYAPELNIGTISVGQEERNVDSVRCREWTEYIALNGKKINCKIDTGAECNVISNVVLKSVMTKPDIKTSKVKLKAYGGTPISSLGVVNLECEVNGCRHNAEFHVVPFVARSILGLDSLMKLNLVNPIAAVHQVVEKSSKTVHTPSPQAPNPQFQKSHLAEGSGRDAEKKIKNEIQKLVETHEEVFKEEKIGCLTRAGSKIRLKTGAEPVQHAARKLAFSIHAEVKDELDRMQKLGVITKVDEPTEWVNSMVVVKQPGKLRICLDPTDLNKWVMREHHHLPTPEETLSKITNARYFTKLDLKSGYWQLPLEENSSKLTTFNTPFGRYRYLRLPFGLNSANEIFQKRMSEKFEGFKGVLIIFDDILVFANTVEEHTARLKAVLDRCDEIGIKLNKKKCQFLCKEVKYIGHIITPEGLKPDPEKITAITQMPPPTDKKGIQRFLGMVTYLARYIPNLSEKTQHLRTILHKDKVFSWDFEQQKAFNDLKRALTEKSALAHYDVTKPVEIHTDACQVGLGACLLQDGKPVAYASRSLTETEKRYANIEKELLSVVFGLERFNQYVYGKHVHVYSDHKPLTPISQRPIHANPARCQRLLLRLQKYDYKLSYKPGKDHVIPDTLSRATIPSLTHDTVLETECELNVHMILETVKSSPSMREQLKIETAADRCLAKITEYILCGWPENAKSCDPYVTPYWSLRDELSIYDGLILYEDKIVIPKVLQKDILNKLHDTHQGRVRCKALARRGVYWRNINADIDNMVDKCEDCLNTRKLPCKVELKSHEVPSRPFEKVGADIVTVYGKKYHVIIDYFSKWIEVSELSISPTSEQLISHFKSIFSRFGFPDIVFSDRESIYASTSMRKFCEKYDIKKNFSSARYSQSNGQVERAIGHVKNIIKRCKGNIDDINMCLLDYRATPITPAIPSPHNILFGRNVKTSMPCLQESLITESDRVNRKLLEDRQEKYASYYNRNAVKSFKLCDPGDLVVYKDGPTDKTWHRAKVVSVDREFRTYTLLNSLGNLITRNRSSVLPDKTGRAFYVSHDRVFDTLQIPTPHPSKNPDPRRIPKAVSMQEGNCPPLPKPHSTPPKTKRVMTIPIKKSTMPPEAIMRYKKISNTCQDQVPLRRSKRIADKVAKLQK